MNKASIFAAFGYVAGVAVGVAISASYLKAKYKSIADEEIQSVKDIYNQPPDPKEFKAAVQNYEESIQNLEKKIPTFQEYKAKTASYIPTRATEFSDAIVKEPPSTPSNWITQDSFLTDYPDYDKITLEYLYTSDLFLDDSGEILPIPDEIFVEGSDVVRDMFRGPGETEPTSLYYRNHSLGSDFEILKQMEVGDDSI